MGLLSRRLSYVSFLWNSCFFPGGAATPASLQEMHLERVAVGFLEVPEYTREH